MRLCAVLAVLTPVVAVAGCADCPPLPEAFNVQVEVVDPLGNELEVQSVRLEHEGEGKTTACSRMRNVHECRLSSPGAHRILVQTEGRTVEQDLDVPEGPGCQQPRGSLRRVTVVYDGPLCEPGTLTAVEGEIFGPNGEPLEFARVQTTPRGETTTRQCEVEGHRYRCPAVDPVSTDYRVQASLGWSVLTQQVTVPIDECTLDEPSALDFDLSEWSCDDTEEQPAFRVYVRTQDGRNALADSVVIRDHRDETAPCALEDAGTEPGPRAYLCPATTSRGAGRYTVEVTDGDHTQVTEEETVQDDGCQPLTQLITVRLQSPN